MVEDTEPVRLDGAVLDGAVLDACACAGPAGLGIDGQTGGAGDSGGRPRERRMSE
jgi:hypothetical protein